MKTKERENSNKFYKLSPSGISLIVLVITIIVIIILATAIIISVIDNNPLSEANKARFQSDRDNMQSIFTNTVAKVMAVNQGSIKIKPGKLNEVTSGVSNVVGVASYEIENGADTVKSSGTITFDNKDNTDIEYYTGKQLPIYKVGETKWYVDSQGIIMLEIGEQIYGEGNKEEIGKGEEGEKIEVNKDEYNALRLRVTQLEEENNKLKSDLEIANNRLKELEIGAGEITSEAKKFTDKNGKVAVIPIGFAIVPGKDVVKDGLVISDVANDTSNVGNQFVWVPVDNINNFKREAGYYNGVIQTSVNPYIDFTKCEEPYSSASKSERQEYENMINSVKEYKGFYIGRYEISLNEETGETQSKKNKTSLVNTIWGNSMKNFGNGIVMRARSMYPYRENLKKGEAVSTLVYGICWDETVRFIKKNYSGIEKDSSGHGNYGTGSAIPTGSKEEYALNNIYDIAGNVWEGTMEAYTTSDRVYRGGVFLYSGQSYPVSCRAHVGTSDSNHSLGGRVQLYIK